LFIATTITTITTIITITTTGQIILQRINTMDTTVFSTRVALSLSDLAATPKNPSSSSSSPPIHSNNNKYELELERLMNKPQGIHYSIIIITTIIIILISLSLL